MGDTPNLDQSKNMDTAAVHQDSSDSEFTSSSDDDYPLELQSLVPEDAIIEAIKVLHGPTAELEDFSATPATSSVQGFLSLILRIVAKFKIQDEDNAVTMVLKRMPVMKEHLELVSQSDFFERECQFFETVLPLLEARRRSGDDGELPVVRCLVARDSIIVMEDLCARGFQTSSASMKQVGSSMSLSHALLAVRGIARIHAASLDIDWLGMFPNLSEDALLEGQGRKMMESYFRQGCEAVAKILTLPGSSAEYQRYVQWLLSPDSYAKSIQFMRPSDRFLNVLGHGDFWENNLMFRSDPESDAPVEVALIDWQLFRYSPVTRDLIYLLFLGFGRSFRTLHEVEILEAYREAFNTAAGQERLTSAALMEEWDEGRMYGALMAATIRPILLIESAFPGENEQMSQEQFRQVMFGLDPDFVLDVYTKNPTFRDTMDEMVEELCTELDRAQILPSETLS